MGVFSSNRSHIAGVNANEITANENYIGGVGALQMTLEGYQNDQAFFEAVIGMDFQEATALHEGVELEVFTEASASQFMEKVKEFVKKAWEKIKGLFQTFITKFNAVVIRDNKTFVDKYKRAVSIKDLSKMKYKWAEPKNDLQMPSMSKLESDVISDINEITANENYIGGVGALQMTLEGYQNDQAFFEAVIGMDFQEATALHEGVELEVFTEASASQFMEKVKEFVKKAWEKIKGLFQTFITKFNAVVIRDNKTFVDKYKRAVSIKDLSKMKYKWAEPKNDLQMPSMSKLESDVISDINDIKKSTSEELEKYVEGLNDSDVFDDALSKIVGFNTDKKSFNKDFRDAMFEDEEEEEGLKHDRLMSIISTLSDKKMISNMEKSKKEFDKYFSKLLSELNKITNELSKKVLSKEADDDASQRKYQIKNAGSTPIHGGYSKGKGSLAVSKVNAIQKTVSTYQIIVNMFVGRFIEENKNYIAQCRRVFAQAASFNPKAVKENAILIEAVGEAAEFELHTLIESAEM